MNDTESKQRGEKILEVSPETVMRLLMGGVEFPPDHLPADVEILGSSYDFSRNVFLIRVQSESFPCLPKWAVPPQIVADGEAGVLQRNRGVFRS